MADAALRLCSVPPGAVTGRVAYSMDPARPSLP
jgi:hypothetical protein